MRTLAKKQEQRYIPYGYGFYNEEEKPWDDLAALKVGKKIVNITIPKRIWWVRAIHWVRALETMYQVWEAMESAASPTVTD